MENKLLHSHCYSFNIPYKKQSNRKLMRKNKNKLRFS